jgi:hypothetical protein
VGTADAALVCAECKREIAIGTESCPSCGCPVDLPTATAPPEVRKPASAAKAGPGASKPKEEPPLSAASAPRVDAPVSKPKEEVPLTAASAPRVDAPASKPKEELPLPAANGVKATLPAASVPKVDAPASKPKDELPLPAATAPKADPPAVKSKEALPLPAAGDAKASLQAVAADAAKEASKAKGVAWKWWQVLLIIVAAGLIVGSVALATASTLSQSTVAQFDGGEAAGGH